MKSVRRPFHDQIQMVNIVRNELEWKLYKNEIVTKVMECTLYCTLYKLAQIEMPF